MSRELVFTVGSGAEVHEAPPISFADAGLRERDDLQEWIIAHPTVLGSDLLIVSCEFDRWEDASGVAAYDRLDLLALDRSGRLVVAELKRDRAPSPVTMQALNYAAMVSRFSLDTLVEVHARYLVSRGRSSDQVLDELRSWAPELSDDTLGPPGVVLVAAEFGAQVTNTALFLYESGIDIRLIQTRLYRTVSGEVVLTTSQLLPVPSAETFMVRPRSAPTTDAAVRTARVRRASIAERLVAHNVLTDGQVLRVAVPAQVDQDRVRITAWLDEDSRRSSVMWRQDPRESVTWAFDDRSYNLTTLIQKIIQEATGTPPRAQVWGPNWYRDAADKPLHKIAEDLADK